MIAEAARLERGRVEDVEREGRSSTLPDLRIPVPALVSGSKRVRHCHSSRHLAAAVPQPDPHANEQARRRQNAFDHDRRADGAPLMHSTEWNRATRRRRPRSSAITRSSMVLPSAPDRGRLIPPSTPTRRRLGPADREAAELRSDHRNADPDQLNRATLPATERTPVIPGASESTRPPIDQLGRSPRASAIRCRRRRSSAGPTRAAAAAR